MALELYHFETCPFCLKVRNCIDELNIKDQIILKDKRIEPKYADELMTLCGNTQVPTLVIDGKPLQESEAINAFLTKTFS